MRSSRRIGLADLPRLVVQGVVQLSHLFGSRYARVEGAHALVTDSNGRVLVVRSAYMGPGWMLPGGRVERDESPHVAAVRETLEETGLQVQVTRLLLADARRARSTSFVFAAEVVGGRLEPQLGEIAEAGWLARDEIAGTSPRLDQLLGLIDLAGGEAGVYLGHHPAP